MYGLYDIEGILRYTGKEPEDCLAYAALFGLKSVEYCLIELTDQNSLDAEITDRMKDHQLMSSN